VPRGLGDLVPDGRDRVEGTEGVLEDDRHALALAVAASPAPRGRAEVTPSMTTRPEVMRPHLATVP